MTRYAMHLNDLVTPQSQPASPKQQANNAGGFSFTVDHWTRLDRFLVLGSEGGTYYVGERKLTVDNAAAVKACLAEDGVRAVKRIVDISDAGRAPKNDPAIFALAIACGSKSVATRSAALAAIPKVCRIGTHLFHFAQDVEGFRRWGRALRTAVAAWYTERPVDKLALQLVKYQQRDGWGHRDLIRLSHPSPKSNAQRAAFAWATGGMEALDVGEAQPGELREHGVGKVRRGADGKKYMKPLLTSLPVMIQAFVEIHKEGTDVKRAIQLITQHELPHECVPNEMKGKPEVWAALLPHMGITAIIRNLAKMTAVGLLKPMGEHTKYVAAQLTDSSVLFKGRVHPMAILIALKQYQSGHGLKGSLTWTPVREVLDALDEAYYLSFQHIEPTGMRHLLGIDVSGSMSGHIANTNLACNEAAAAMAMVTARVEKQWAVCAFDQGFRQLDISPRQRMDDVVRMVKDINGGGTDCSLPMLYALKNKIPVDVFHVYTDCETWAGRIHPHQALKQYRDQMGIPAKLVVAGMVATNFTIADPDDVGMLDVVGFDAAAPGIIADFAAAREVQA